MLVLALDTAAEVCAACLWDAAGGERGRAVAAMRTGHAEHLMETIEEALAKAGAMLSAVDRVAVAVGPGSFTGIRVGVAAARGLALALGVPALGISTLEAVAAEVREAKGERRVLAAFGAGEDRIQAALYDGMGRTLHAPASLDAEAARGWAAQADLLGGSAAPRLAALAGKPAASVADTVDIAVYARLAAGREPGGKPVPLYLRAPDAKPQGAALPRRPR
jgi:tRNA threonylcarbamoyladenosine biosynthesis protein TsaB